MLQTVNADEDLDTVEAVVEGIYSNIPRDEPLGTIDSI